MRSCLFAVCALALIAVSVGVKCQHKQHTPSLTLDEKPKECTNTTYCTWFEGVNANNVTLSDRNCDDSDIAPWCTEEGCRDYNYSLQSVPIPGILCCCLGDYCNVPRPAFVPPTISPPSNPTTDPTSLLSIAILAAVRSALD